MCSSDLREKKDWGEKGSCSLISVHFTKWPEIKLQTVSLPAAMVIRSGRDRLLPVWESQSFSMSHVVVAWS